MKIHRIKGFADLFSPESDTFTYIENLARTVFSACGFTELRTPVMEETALFRRGIGEETDVVNKEMYSLTTEGGHNYSLRPEATAGVMRAYIENSLYAKSPISRLFTIGPMFRHERPQKGRLRQFHQLNCECLGSDSPVTDADVICMLMRFLTKLKLPPLELHLNSLGCHSCRPVFKEALREYLEGKLRNNSGFCADCERRISTNPLRVLDCKHERCQALLQDAPRIKNYLCPECRDHFLRVCSLLEHERISFILDDFLVRGLDYYCRTTFEVRSGDIGSQSAVAGGGRYDALVEQLGGPKTPGIGFACGMERLALLMPNVERRKSDFYLLAMDEQALIVGFSLLQDLRNHGFSGEMNFQIQSFKSLMRQADKSGALYSLILGSSEVEQRSVTIKNMRDGSQVTISQDSAGAFLKTGLSNE